LWAFTPRIAGASAHDIGSCDRGGEWCVYLALGNPAGISQRSLAAFSDKVFAIMEAWASR
jgi:hypothetical protein